MEETKKPKILVVDDEEKNLKLLSIILQSGNYDIQTATNGREALEKTREYSPDLILLDVMMPEMDGFETCRRLREDPDTRFIPVVMVTALGDQESRNRGLDAGADDFLTKPVDRTEVLIRAKNLLRVKEFEDFLKKHNELLEAEVKARTAELWGSYIDTIDRLTVMAEYKDEDTANHIKRVGLYSSHIAETLGLPRMKPNVFFVPAPCTT